MSRGHRGPRKPQEDTTTQQRHDAYIACGGLMHGANDRWTCVNHCRIPLQGRNYCVEGEKEVLG